MSPSDTLPTIWRVPDPLWETLNKVLTVYDPAPPMGRPRINQRLALDGILYRMRTGCQWNALPREFGDDASVYRTFRRWEDKGIFDILWAVLLVQCEELGGVDWQWQAADCCLGKARGVPKQAGQTDNPRAAKKGRPRKPSEPTLPTGASQVSRRACLSRAEAVRLQFVSPEPTATI
jgi:putative transposase